MNAESLLYQLSHNEDECARLYASLAKETQSHPIVSSLFTRLSQDELKHKESIQMTKAYQSQGASLFVPYTDCAEKVQKIRSSLIAFHDKMAQKSLSPPYIDLLEEVLRFEEEMESSHYSSYLDIDDAELRQLLLQLTQFDKNHVSLIKHAIETVKSTPLLEERP